MNQETYYLINGYRLGKCKEGEYYLYNNGKWVYDKDQEIFGRLYGYDPFEPPGSPYAWGSTSVIDEIEEISEEEAEKQIRKDFEK